MTEVYKGWAIFVFFFETGLRALVSRPGPGSTLGESVSLTTPDPDGQEALIEAAKVKIDCLIRCGADSLSRR